MTDVLATPMELRKVLKNQCDIDINNLTVLDMEMIDSIEYDENGNAKLKMLECIECGSDAVITDYKSFQNCYIS